MLGLQRVDSGHATAALTPHAAQMESDLDDPTAVINASDVFISINEHEGTYNEFRHHPLAFRCQELHAARRDDTIDPCVRIMCVGDETCGKTCFMTRLWRNWIYEERYETTIGVDYNSLRIYHSSIMAGNALTPRYIRVTLVDSGGQRRFHVINRHHYRGSKGFFLCYGVDNRRSFENLQRLWLPEVRELCNLETSAMVVVGLRCDVDDFDDDTKKRRRQMREVPYAEGEAFARSLDLPFIECSARENLNIYKCLATLLHHILRKDESARLARDLEAQQRERDLKACNPRHRCTIC